MGFMLYWQVFWYKKIDFQQLQTAISAAWQGANYYYLLMAIFLIPLNWHLEVYKWLFIMIRYEKISYGQATKAILLGLTVSLFTPNRVGEYGGRMLLVDKQHRPMAIYATMIGNFAQWIILLLFGLLGLLFFINYNHIFSETHIFWQKILFIAGLCLFILLTTAYFYHQRLFFILNKFAFLRKYTLDLSEKLALYAQKGDYLHIFFIAGARYLVYTFQYIFLLYFFSFENTFINHFSCIAIIYFIQTGMPVPPATGLLVRANVALWIFSQYNSLGVSGLEIQTKVLAATLSLWLMNIFFPALFGYYLLFRYSFRKNG